MVMFRLRWIRLRGRRLRETRVRIRVRFLVLMVQGRRVRVGEGGI